MDAECQGLINPEPGLFTEVDILQVSIYCNPTAEDMVLTKTRLEGDL